MVRYHANLFLSNERKVRIAAKEEGLDENVIFLAIRSKKANCRLSRVLKEALQQNDESGSMLHQQLTMKTSADHIAS